MTAHDRVNYLLTIVLDLVAGLVGPIPVEDAPAKAHNLPSEDAPIVERLVASAELLQARTEFTQAKVLAAAHLFGLKV